MATAASKEQMHGSRSTMLDLILQLRTFIALIVVMAYFAVMAPNFLSQANFLIMFGHVAITAILAIGMTYVILTGGIDLSVGSTVGLSGMVAGWLILYGLPVESLGVIVYPNILSVIVIALAVGAAIGLVNGLLITRFGVAPFIATLGTLYVVRGAAMLASGGTTFSNLVGNASHGNEGFPLLGAGTVYGVPVPVLIVCVLALIAAFVAKRTPFGRHIYATGGNERAALLSGVRVNRVKVAVYVISGICAALVGLIVASELVAANPASGETFELGAIAAVVLGGASLSGGRGTIGGSLIGACVITVLTDGMVMMGVSEFWQMVLKGTVIIAAVVLDRIQWRLSGNSPK